MTRAVSMPTERPDFFQEAFNVTYLLMSSRRSNLSISCVGSSKASDVQGRAGGEDRRETPKSS